MHSAVQCEHKSNLEIGIITPQKNTDVSKTHFTATSLAQLGERRSAEREVTGSNPGQTNTQGLQITEKKVLHCNGICKQLDFLVFLDKDEKL